MGYLLKWSEGGAKIDLEADTISCSHCQKVVCKQTVVVDGRAITGWNERGAWCWGCGKPLCLSCYGRLSQTGCIPFLKQMEKALQRARLKSQV